MRRGLSAFTSEVEAVDLPGLNGLPKDPATDLSAGSIAQHLIQEIERFWPGRPCVLVAHSLGGAIATLVAQERPDLVAHLVYVCAVAPVSGRSSASYNVLPEMADSLLPANFVGDPIATGVLQLDPHDPARRELLRQTFYADVEPSVADEALDRLNPQAALAPGLDVPVITRDKYGSVEHSYVLCEQDQALRPALQARFVAEIDAVSRRATRLRTLASSHSPFLSQPEALAKILLATTGLADPDDGA